MLCSSTRHRAVQIHDAIASDLQQLLYFVLVVLLPVLGAFGSLLLESRCVVFQLYAGLRSGKVLCFSCSERTFTASCDCTGGEGTLVGLGKNEE